MLKCVIFSAVVAAFAAPVFAEVAVTFRDGAPKDRFVITSSLGLCTDAAAEIRIDLGPTAGRLTFDITAGGRGVEVFQPFELVSGGEFVTGATEVFGWRYDAGIVGFLAWSGH